MSLIETAIRWRHGTFVSVCLLGLLGLFCGMHLPLELQPGGDRQEITITTNYPGAAPSDVEDLITRPIEEQMEGVLGVQEISSSSRSGRSSITLEFGVNRNLQEGLLDVITQLQRVSGLPTEANSSEVRLVGGNTSPMMWIPLDSKPGFTPDADRYRDLVEDVLAPRLRQVDGVGQLLITGGQLREVEVRVDPQSLADRNLTIGDVVRVLRDNNRDIRGGPLVVGRREYRVRTVSRSQNLNQLGEFILRRNERGVVYLRDVATIVMGRKLQDSALMLNGKPAVALGIIRQVGANVPAVSRGVRQVIAQTQSELDRLNFGVQFSYNYDESDYITQAVSLVQQNLFSGALLAVLILILFLGSMRTVAVVALTIPTSLVSVFIIMALTGRTLNIISLAALGFASGMVVDSAIVVIENIFTHLQQGKGPVRAAIDGTHEVWGALVGSSLTNVAVFLPLALVQGEVAQLFIDMTITMTAATGFSLLSAITIVPMLSGLFLSQSEALQVLSGDYSLTGNWMWRAIARSSAIFRIWQGRLEKGLLTTVTWGIGRGRLKQRLIVLTIPLFLIGFSYFTLPPADYLPQGNRNQILWRAEPLPGTSIPESIALSQPLQQFLRQQPEIDRTLFIDRPGGLRAISIILKPEYGTDGMLSAMVQRLRQQSGNFAGYRFLIPSRSSIFRDPGKEFKIHIIGSDLDQLNQFDQEITTSLRTLPGVNSVRSNFVFGAAELQIIPNRERLAEAGISESDLAGLVEVGLGGRLASKLVDGANELDVVVKLKKGTVGTPSQLRQLPLFTGNGRRLQLSDVAEVRETTAPDVIHRINSQRSITLTIGLADDAPLGALLKRVRDQIILPFQEAAPPGYQINLAGSADRLAETTAQLAAAFSVSIGVIYLLLVALYRSWIYPLVIMATVPMGMSGGLLSLVLVNWIPGVLIPFDMITALGFIMLSGIVVNNAILIVERSLQLQRSGIAYEQSLYEATQDRLRAIFMSAGTSVLGMLPLALVPGQGAELYQGLGIVLTGGLALSTLLTPTVVPALMGLIQNIVPSKS